MLNLHVNQAARHWKKKLTVRYFVFYDMCCDKKQKNTGIFTR